MAPKNIEFNGKNYNVEILDAMADTELLELRNLVASNLGVAASKAFKDHNAAVTQTLKALEKYEATVAAEAAGEEAPAAAEKPKREKKPKKETTPRVAGIPKSAEPKTVKRPTRKMFSAIKKTGEHDGSQGRGGRWDNYKDGMTIIDVMETNGTEPWDVYNWEKHGIMSVTEPTDEEYAARRAAWYEAKGQEDPDAKKEREAAEKAAAKAERDAEREAKKAAAEKAKAERAAAAEAKAAAEAEAKTSEPAEG
jgi:hypothetical protein